MDTLGFFIERGWGFDNGNVVIGGLALDLHYTMKKMLATTKGLISLDQSLSIEHI